MYGLPVIAKINFEIPSFIEDEKTGYLLKNNDPKELADAMYRLLNNQKYANEVNRKYEEYIEYYSWENAADIIIEEMDEEKKCNCM
jgi:glycosyltransferase involved in cell wall biosynthesis